MKYFWILIIASTLGSCHLFESQEEKTKALVDKELQEMDWNTVDHYPLFYTCDETATKEEQKACFEKEITTHFKKTLDDFEFAIPPETDTIVYVVFVIDTVGKLKVLDIQKDPQVAELMPEFNGVLTQSLKNLPDIDPALKKGIPITTKFRIPIVLSSN